MCVGGGGRCVCVERGAVLCGGRGAEFGRPLGCRFVSFRSRLPRLLRLFRLLRLLRLPRLSRRLRLSRRAAVLRLPVRRACSPGPGRRPPPHQGGPCRISRHSESFRVIPSHSESFVFLSDSKSGRQGPGGPLPSRQGAGRRRAGKEAREGEGVVVVGGRRGRGATCEIQLASSLPLPLSLSPSASLPPSLPPTLSRSPSFLVSFLALLPSLHHLLFRSPNPVLSGIR